MDRVKFACHRHSLNRRELLSGEENGVCGLCGKEVTDGSTYECSECNFTAHLDCAKNPPSLEIESKNHEHTLTLLPRQVSFTCNACAIYGDKSPYVCLKCCFMVHRDCTDFPLVVQINRHNHRLSYTWFLGPGHWKCGVCRRKIDWNYGAYKCAKCCSYAAHLRCALRADVWGGKELEEKPEEDKEIEDSKLVDDKPIEHFSHQHVLRLEKEDNSDVVCSGCTFPVASDPFYRCTQCDFFLHKTCAYLPWTIFAFLHVHPLTLCVDEERSGGPNGLSRCGACDLPFNGFRYRCLECKDDHIEFDIRCSSVTDLFVHDFHPNHPLFYLGAAESEEDKICNGCNHQGSKHVLSCIKCDFKMCFACATLPAEVIYKYDEHKLSPTMGEGVTYWCDMCEYKIDELKSYYKCSHCGLVLHTECALGSFRNMRPGFTFITQHGQEYKVILNDRTSLLRCSQCHNDCHEPLLLMSTTTDVTIYLCSSPCFETYVSA